MGEVAVVRGALRVGVAAGLAAVGGGAVLRGRARVAVRHGAEHAAPAGLVAHAKPELVGAAVGVVATAPGRRDVGQIGERRGIEGGLGRGVDDVRRGDVRGVHGAVGVVRGGGVADGGVEGHRADDALSAAREHEERRQGGRDEP